MSAPTETVSNPVGVGVDNAVRLFTDANYEEAADVARGEVVRNAVGATVTLLRESPELYRSPVAVATGAQIVATAAISRQIAESAPLDEEEINFFIEILRRIFDGLLDK